MISCHKKYSNKSDLSQHKKVHNESKCFKCEICLKVFNEKQNLKRHYRTHTGEKPFDCQICGRKFACKSNLVRHQATHSKIKSFKCTICSESRFKSKFSSTNLTSKWFFSCMSSIMYFKL